MTLVVNEIFHSIQGESLHAGRPCSFIRLTGCNLRCSYCDTRYAYDQGFDMDIKQIIHQIDSYNCGLVEITGGEPLLQEQTPLLIKKLLLNGYQVLLETNGSLDISVVDRQCIKVIDFKCPSSKESDKNRFDNIQHLGPRDQIKMVIGDRADYKYAKQIIKNIKNYLPNDFPMDHILFSPITNKISPELLAGWILADGLAVRLHLQIHKIIWPDQPRGV